MEVLCCASTHMHTRIVTYAMPKHKVALTYSCVPSYSLYKKLCMFCICLTLLALLDRLVLLVTTHGRLTLGCATIGLTNYCTLLVSTG
jgi:hypothetical protein